MTDKIESYGIYNQPPYLLEQFRNTDVQKLLEAIDPQFNELEAAAFDLFTKVWLANATGTQLDVLGIHLGLRREGRTDEMYRVLLDLKSKINTSGGTPEIIIETIKFLYNATEAHYTVDPPAKIEVEQDGIIGLLFYSPIELNGGDMLVDDVGDQLIFAEPDDLAVAILDSVIPVGVKLTVNQMI
jgi:hypothetical protein